MPLLSYNISRITEITAKLNTETEDEIDEGDSIPITITYGTEWFEVDDGTIDVVLITSVDGESSPLTLTFEITGNFDFAGVYDDDDEELNKELRVEAGSILFPLLQEHVLGLTRKMGLPLLNLPAPDFASIDMEK